MLASNQENIGVLSYLRRNKLETDKDFEVQLQKFTVLTSLRQNHNLEPETKDNSQKSSIEPTNKEPEKPKTNEGVYEDSDFWFNKGCEYNKKNESDLALKCFFRALDF